MSMSTIIGLAALAVGLVLLGFAWRSANAPVDQVSEALTGRFTGDTMWMIGAGLVGVVVGAALLIRGQGRGRP